MSGKKSPVPGISILCLVLFWVTVAACSVGTERLVICDAGTGKVYGSWPVEGGTEFSVEFIHSVNQSPVRDTFRVEGKSIRPVTTRFSSFGAGMQTELREGQRLIRDDEGYMLITGFTESFDELNFIVGTVSDHTLFINNEALSLRELCGRNAHIVFRVRWGRR